MANIHVPRIWDSDRHYATPESVFESRRSFLKSAGATGLAITGGLLPGLKSAMGDDADELSESLKPPADSGFKIGDRNAQFELDRPMTKERVAAQYNNFYEFGVNKAQCWRNAQSLTTRPWLIEIAGLVEKPLTLDIDELLRTMPSEERLYRFRCVERWAMAVPWTGFPLRALLDRVRPLSAAKYVRFVSFHRPEQAVGQKMPGRYQWPYYEGLTIEEATNDLCFVATGVYGHDLPKQHGAPLRLVVPWKYGYKGAKSVVKIELTAKQPKTFWNDLQAREYGFFSNVDPNKPHPRWPQTTETMIGTNKVHDTQIYNGYGQFVSNLYQGDEH